MEAIRPVYIRECKGDLTQERSDTPKINILTLIYRTSLSVIHLHNNCSEASLLTRLTCLPACMPAYLPASLSASLSVCICIIYISSVRTVRLVPRRHPRYAGSLKVKMSLLCSLPLRSHSPWARLGQRAIMRCILLVNIMGVSDRSCVGSEQSSNRFSYYIYWDKNDCECN